jgi:hypothetical protein
MNFFKIITVLKQGEAFTHKQFWQNVGTASTALIAFATTIETLVPGVSLTPDEIKVVAVSVAHLMAVSLGYEHITAQVFQGLWMAIGLLVSWLLHKYFTVATDTTRGFPSTGSQGTGNSTTQPSMPSSGGTGANPGPADLFK